MFVKARKGVKVCFTASIYPADTRVGSDVDSDDPAGILLFPAGCHFSVISPKGKPIHFILELFKKKEREKKTSPPLPAHKHHNVLPSVLVIIISINSRMRCSDVCSRARCVRCTK